MSNTSQPTQLEGVYKSKNEYRNCIPVSVGAMCDFPYCTCKKKEEAAREPQMQVINDPMYKELAECPTHKTRLEGGWCQECKKFYADLNGTAVCSPTAPLIYPSSREPQEEKGDDVRDNFLSSFQILLQAIVWEWEKDQSASVLDKYIQEASRLLGEIRTEITARESTAAPQGEKEDAEKELADLRYRLSQEWEHEANVSANACAAVNEAIEKYTDRNMNFTRDYLRPALHRHGITLVHLGFPENMRKEIASLTTQLSEAKERIKELELKK